MPNIAKALTMLASESSVGDDFFATATTALVKGLGCRLAGISCLSDGGEFVRMLAPAGQDAFADLLRFPLAGLPGESLYQAPEAGFLHITDDFAQRYRGYHDQLDFPPRWQARRTYFYY